MRLILRKFSTSILALIVATLFCGTIFMIKADDPEVTNTENRITKSLDWDSCDSMYLLKIAEYHGGKLEDRIRTINVTLNIVWRDLRTIEDVVLNELYRVDRISAYEFEEIIPSELTKEALRQVMIEKIDYSNKSTEFLHKGEENDEYGSI